MALRVMALLFLTFSTTPPLIASAAHPLDPCATIPYVFQGMWDANSDRSWPDEAYWKNSAKIAKSQGEEVNKECKPGPEREYAAAYTFALEAAIKHHYGDPWQTDMNMALQLLEKCVTHYYGTEKGAQCQTDIETNIARKTKWAEADGS